MDNEKYLWSNGNQDRRRGAGEVGRGYGETHRAQKFKVCIATYIVLKSLAFVEKKNEQKDITQFYSPELKIHIMEDQTQIVFREFNKKNKLKDIGLFSLKNKRFERDVVYICRYLRTVLWTILPLFWVDLEGRYGIICSVVWGVGFGSKPKTFCVLGQASRISQLPLPRIGTRS